MGEDRLIGTKINKDGYGIIPKSVMQDRNLSISAKAVYAYFCSFAGQGDCCFPTRKKICVDLDISNDSLSKYLNQLVSEGYLTVEQGKENGRFSHNVYTLPDARLPCPKISDTEDSGAENSDTKNNNTKNNSISKNNIVGDKKESAKAERHSKGSFDKMIEEYTDSETTRDLLREWLKVRKAKRAAMTDRAIKMNLDKLDDFAKQSRMSVDDYLSEVIRKGWQAFYAIKTYGCSQSDSDNNNSTFDTSDFFKAALTRSFAELDDE